jgi:ubiquinone/menaquinone biosynthesis C-methylase UbiE
MTQVPDLKGQQQKQWSSVADGWERYDQWFEVQTKPLTDWMVEVAGIRPGSQVLDVACGTGQPAIAAAQRAQPDGKVVATDLSPQMVEAARRIAAAAGIQNLEFRVMDAERIDFPDNSFDAVTCRFGLMFCPEPSRAAADMLRVLKPGSRVSLTVWGAPTLNPFFMKIIGPLAAITGTAPPDPQAPGIFRFAQPGALEQTLKAAGFRDVSVEPTELIFEWESAEAYWEMQLALAAPIRVAVQTLPAETVEKLKASVIEGLVGEQGTGPIRLMGTPLRATAVK